MIFTHCPFCHSELQEDAKNQWNIPSTPYHKILIFDCPNQHFSLQFNDKHINWFHIAYTKQNRQTQAYFNSFGTTVYVSTVDDQNNIEPLSKPLHEFFDITWNQWDFSSLEAIQAKLNLLLAFS